MSFVRHCYRTTWPEHLGLSGPVAPIVLAAWRTVLTGLAPRLTHNDDLEFGDWPGPLVLQVVVHELLNRLFRLYWRRLSHRSLDFEFLGYPQAIKILDSESEGLSLVRPISSLAVPTSFGRRSPVAPPFRLMRFLLFLVVLGCCYLVSGFALFPPVTFCFSLSLLVPLRVPSSVLA